MQIGKIIKKYRLKSNMTQVELGARLGLESGQYISNLERGYPASVSILKMLSRILKIPKKLVINAYVDDSRNKIMNKLW